MEIFFYYENASNQRIASVAHHEVRKDVQIFFNKPITFTSSSNPQPTEAVKVEIEEDDDSDVGGGQDEDVGSAPVSPGPIGISIDGGYVDHFCDPLC